MYESHEAEVILFDTADTFTDLGSDSNITPLPGVDVSGYGGTSDN